MRLLLPASSAATFAATLTVIVPSPDGVTVNVKTPLPSSENDSAVMDPPPTTASPSMNSVTVSPKSTLIGIAAELVGEESVDDITGVGAADATVMVIEVS